MEEAEARFLAEFPDYIGTSSLDRLRDREYARLDRLGHVYLDYTGGGLYGDHQMREHFELLAAGIYGNPHSHNPSSEPTGELVEKTRAEVLEYFNAAPDEYVVIFTANASTALKLVGEAYPFGAGDHFLLTFDNHNSVNGIREFARSRGAGITYVPLVLPEMRVEEETLSLSLNELANPSGHNLFAYPAQSNFSGVQHPLQWVEQAQQRGWDVLLDAAAFVPTNRLDLTAVHPDFVCLSFYKMFGYPTGIGCLIARRKALQKLHRPWFSGGTITVASVQGDRYFLAEGSSAFEDGTPDYLSIPAVGIGLRHLHAANLDVIKTRTQCLSQWLIRQLLSLRHGNGQPLIRLYGPAGENMRGGTVTMNFYDASDSVINHLRVEAEASRHSISLRTGCFCNPGGGELALGISRSELATCFTQPKVELTHKFSVDDFTLCVDGKSTGAVRVSLGIVSNFADVWRFVQFASEFVTG